MRGFKYKDSRGENGPVKAVQLKKSGSGLFQMKAAALGKLGVIEVVPPDLGTDGCVRLDVGGGGDTYHVRFGADGQVTNDGAKQFKVVKPTVQGICPIPSCPFLLKWGVQYGMGNGELNFAAGVATDGNGNVYVADSNNHRIQKFDASGAFLVAWGSVGSGNGQLVYPNGVATDGSGNVGSKSDLPFLPASSWDGASTSRLPFPFRKGLRLVGRRAGGGG